MTSRALVLDADDHPVGLLEVLDRGPLAQKFRIGDHREPVARRALGQDALDRVARADRNRGLDYDDGEILDRLRDRPGGLVHVVHVGRSDFGQ